MGLKTREHQREEPADNFLAEINASLEKIDLQETDTSVDAVESNLGHVDRDSFDTSHTRLTGETSKAFVEDTRDAFGNRTHSSRAKASLVLNSPLVADRTRRQRQTDDHPPLSKQPGKDEALAGKARAPEIRITPTDTSGEFRAKILLCLGLLAAIGLAGAAWWVNSTEPDPHFLSAREWQASYERGKLESERNYNHPIYTKILNELGLVDPGSVSAEPAAAMASELEIQIQEFLLRQRQTNEGRARRLHDRNQKIFEAQRRARANPVDTYPECDEE